jgi:hypothetical protein
MCIVPSSFLGSEFWERSRIRFIDRDFSFIGQTELDPDAFAGSGVEYFQTKVMMFMRSAHCIESRPYDAEGSVSWEELGRRIAEARELKRKLRLKLMQETKTLNAGEEMVFRYAVDKYLYELKTHKTHKKHHGKALALVSRFRNQRPPENATESQREEYERGKLTYAKVLAVLRRYIREQDRVPRKEVALVRTSHGFKLKAYAPRMPDKAERQSDIFEEFGTEMSLIESLMQKNYDENGNMRLAWGRQKAGRAPYKPESATPDYYCIRSLLSYATATAMSRLPISIPVAFGLMTSKGMIPVGLLRFVVFAMTKCIKIIKHNILRAVLPMRNLLY